MQRIRSWISSPALMLIVLYLLAAGCKKRPPVVAPTPSDQPRPEAPTTVPRPDLDVFLQAERDGRLWLVWKSARANSVVIDRGIGSVQPDGRIQVPVSTGVTYRVTAHGPGGSTWREIRVEAAGSEPAGKATDDRLPDSIRSGMRAVFFDLDSHRLGEEARRILDENIAWLMQPENRDLCFTIQGHSDPAGSDEFGHSLADLRAALVMGYLVERGVEARRMQAVSLGEEESREFPAERAAGRNGRVVFVPARPGEKD